MLSTGIANTLHLPTTRSIRFVLEESEHRLVLVDIGASGAPPRVWRPLLDFSTYVGFDPDARESQTESSRNQQRILIDRAIGLDANERSVDFYLTKNPYCSSTCRPDMEKLDDYLFSDRFEVVSRSSEPATSLDAAMDELGISRIDWLKLDTQGIDLRIYQSMAPELQNSLVAIDIEPGLDAYYHSEDTFTEVHTRLIEDGFWLSGLNVGGSPWGRRDSLLPALKAASRVASTFYEATMDVNPTYVEARYMRTIRFLSSPKAQQEHLVSAWAAAQTAGDFGFAFEVASLLADRFEDTAVSAAMGRFSLSALRRNSALHSYRLIRHLTPNKVRRFFTKDY